MDNFQNKMYSFSNQIFFFNLEKMIELLFFIDPSKIQALCTKFLESYLEPQGIYNYFIIYLDKGSRKIARIKAAPTEHAR